MSSHARARRREARQRISVLIGTAISQLPIWGFAMNYGVFQEWYSDNWTLAGSRSTTGIIGTTSNGVMYLSMPFLFAAFTRRFASHRKTASLCGAVLTCISFLLSSFSTNVWHLVLTQGVLSAFGCALVYSPLTLSLGEWFNTRNRAVAYAVALSCKNIVGSTCPFLFRFLLDRYDFRMTLRIWAIVTAVTSVLSIWLVPTHPSRLSFTQHAPPAVPWTFLRHRTFWIYSIAIMLQTCGYGLPQTYLNTYAHSVTHLSQNTATLLLTLFNIPGIFASPFFGYLTDNKRHPVSAPVTTAISAVSTCLSALLLWGFTRPGDMALLVLFSMTFGFFAGGYSATWGGVINELESEAAQCNEAVDTGMLYGLLNGARGIGYVSGGLIGVPLLRAGAEVASSGDFGYKTAYGPLIIFTGLSSVFGGWALIWSICRRMSGFLKLTTLELRSRE